MMHSTNPQTGNLQPKDISLFQVSKSRGHGKTTIMNKKIRFNKFEKILNEADQGEIEEMILFAGLKIHKKVSIGDIEE